MARPVWTAQCTAGRLVRELLPVRRQESHKGDYGRVLLLCGSEGLTGAARLAAKGALPHGKRSGISRRAGKDLSDHSGGSRERDRLSAAL